MQHEDHLKGLEIELSYARRLGLKEQEALVLEQIKLLEGEEGSTEEEPEPEEVVEEEAKEIEHNNSEDEEASEKEPEPKKRGPGRPRKDAS